ncbi:uncharacterized protein JCM6883_003691 [Sporobolomyces salmoneus]|uniref:uncharacterized protein n=1 Tax=Sporobolomyces salmoneus TaxID=183962 RepID=UPI003180FA70
MSTNPIAISSASSGLPNSTSLPGPLLELVKLRTQADSSLHSPALEQELSEGIQGPQVAIARDALREVIELGREWESKVSGKLTREQQARGKFCLAWALGRIGEYDGTKPIDLPNRLNEALEHYQEAADLLDIPAPPLLDRVPSVTRPGDSKRQSGLDLPEVPAFAGEMLAEWARTQTTLAFSSLLTNGGETVIDEDRLADLLEMACRRNVQALFTPIDPLSSVDDISAHEAGTVMGNSRLIRQLSSFLPFTSSPILWSRHLNFATHVADVRFVEVSMTATRLVDACSAQASVLQDPKISNRDRNEVRKMLELTMRRLAPLERMQGNVLLGLGRVMLDAVGALYLGRTEGFLAERRRRENEASAMGEEEGEAEEDGEGSSEKQVPENDLVRETRQVLIRAAALFENAYASFLKSPANLRKARFERRLLRRLEATYCDLEILDNETPEVVELRSQRIERALWINERLIALEDGKNGQDEDYMDESDDEDEGADSEDEDESERLARRLGKQRLV